MDDDKPVLMFGTPVYGGLTPDYVLSLIETRAALRDAGIFSYVEFIRGIALVSYARNELAAAFRRSRGTTGPQPNRLLMIDADIGWKKETVFKLLERSKRRDFVGAAPPHRRFNGKLVAEKALQGVREPERFGQDYAVRMTDEDRARGKAGGGDGFIRLAAVGSAFLMLTPSVFDRIQEKAGDSLKYTSPEGHEAHAFFDPFIRDGQSLGEDGAFCQRWKDAGGDIELLVDAPMTHEGPVRVAGNLADLMYEGSGSR